jgi:CubicO group peptidase (beta-lactamase class C family)
MLLSRRHFMVGGAGAVVAATRPNLAWPSQSLPNLIADSGGPHWRPSAELLHNLPDLLELAAVPGLAVTVVDGGGEWTRGFGRAVENPAEAVANDTVFEAASLGKPVFAYAVLRLVDAGMLNLDRPLFSYLPIPEADNPRMKRVTARHVLSHTTGLPNWRQEPAILEPASEPGQQFSYSGEAYFYLQRVVEVVTGNPLAHHMRDEVLNPLGMKHSSYVWQPAFGAAMAAGYDGQGRRVDVQAPMGQRTLEIAEQWAKPLVDWRYEDSAKAVTLVNPQWPVLPLYMVPNVAASLLTTANDYGKFLRRLVAPSGNEKVGLAESTRREMATPQIHLNSALSWGLGWGIQQDEYGQVLWHWGANNSFRNFAIADPANGRAIVVLTNSENGPRVYERVIVSITGHDHPAFLWI